MAARGGTEAGEMKHSLMPCEAPHAPRASLAGMLSAAYTNSMRLAHIIVHTKGMRKPIDVGTDLL